MNHKHTFGFTHTHHKWWATRPLKNLFGALVLVSTLLLANEVCTTNSPLYYSEFEFALDTTNSDHLGFSPGWPGIGPKSITLGKGCVYIVDDYHFNIKRIDLKTGELTASERVSSREYCWPVDAIECAGNILVSDSFDSIFVFDSNLVRLSSVYVGERDDRFFLREEGGGLLLYSELNDVVCSVSCQGEIGSLRDTLLLARQVHGMPFSVAEQDGQTVLQTKYFNLPLAKGTENISQAIDHLDCSYLDYDSSRVVYFNVRDSVLVLYYYQHQRD